MTFDDLIERARRQINIPDRELDLGACVMQARQRVARQVMGDASLCGLLMQEYSVPLDSSGRGNLLTAVGSVTGDAGEIFVDGVRRGVVLDSGGVKVHSLLYYSDFLAPQNTAYDYYAITADGTIHTRVRDQQVFTASDIQSAAGPLTITANYCPSSVEDFPVELEPMLVQELCDIIRPISASTSNA